MLLNCGVGEDSWDSLGICKEIQPVHPKGNQFWIFIRRTDAEVEAEYFSHLMWRTDSLEKTPIAKDWRQEGKGTTEDEMVGWHHQIKGHEFEQTLRDSEGQGSLARCIPWGLKESDMTEWLNNYKACIQWEMCAFLPKRHQQECSQQDRSVASHGNSSNAQQ